MSASHVVYKWMTTEIPAGERFALVPRDIFGCLQLVSNRSIAPGQDGGYTGEGMAEASAGDAISPAGSDSLLIPELFTTI